MATVGFKGLSMHEQCKTGQLSVGDFDFGFDVDVAKLVEESQKEQRD